MNQKALLFCTLLGGAVSIASGQNKDWGVDKYLKGGNTFIHLGASALHVQIPYDPENTYLGFVGVIEPRISKRLTFVLKVDYYSTRFSETDGSLTILFSKRIWSTSPGIRYYFDQAFKGFYVGAQLANLTASSKVVSPFPLLGGIDLVPYGGVFSCLEGAIGGAFALTPRLHLNLAGNIGVAVSHAAPNVSLIGNLSATIGYRF